jgi:DNA-binding transcriptional regulator YhcF (GntR family)
MERKFVINTAVSIPVYKQIISQVEQKIISGEYAPGYQLPSMNELAAELDISKETIKKAYAILRDKGVIEPHQGKGFYVKGLEEERPMRILLLFDKLSSYKQVLIQSFIDKIGGNAEVTIRIHNQNLDVFEFFIDEDVDHFDYYVVTPHFPLDVQSQKRMLKLLKRIPNRKLILVDKNIADLPGNYGAVYQDFSKDIAIALAEGLDKLRRFSRLNAGMPPAIRLISRNWPGIFRIGRSRAGALRCWRAARPEANAWKRRCPVRTSSRALPRRFRRR